MTTKQLKILRALTSTALISLLLGAVLTVMSGLFSTFYSIMVGIGTVLITLYCYRRADQKISASRDYYLWRYVPTLVFVFGPLILMALSATEGDWSVTGWLLFLRFGVSFLIPIACLMMLERLLKQALQAARSDARDGDV
ncbi:hypothetical protein [Litorivivens sp.]|uniref:hypothetical protein n=1 Tax=Litorivivens sp. TaxID=2020868 RepID=UPI003562DB2C